MASRKPPIGRLAFPGPDLPDAKINRMNFNFGYFIAPRKFGALGYILCGRPQPQPDCFAEGVSPMPLQNSDVWFITGCSTGFGRELAKLVLNRGYRVVITARDPGKILDLKVGHERSALVLE